MTHAVATILSALFVFATVVAGPGDARADGNDIKDCYSVHGEARYGALAYKHVVIVTNRCDIELQCEVWTDVDPNPRQPLSVAANATGEVIVRAVSPARAFTAFGECTKK